jgi:hypothetical protein
MSEQTQVRVYFTGDCEGLAAVREALEAHEQSTSRRRPAS